MIEYPSRDFQRLGFTELLSGEIAQYAEVEHGMYSMLNVILYVHCANMSRRTCPSAQQDHRRPATRACLSLCCYPVRHFPRTFV
jgi:hypothetical protein